MGILSGRDDRRRAGWRKASPGALAVFLLALGLAVGMPAGRAQADQPAALSDSALKAAFLFNFVKFTDWPALQPGRPLVLCVAGDDRVASALVEIVRGRKVGDRDLRVTRGKSDMPVDGCQTLFLARSDTRGAGPALELQTQPVLTVSDGEGFARAGGIVEFFIERDQMRFMVNPKAVQRAGLKLSSRLLGLARIVQENHGS